MTNSNSSELAVGIEELMESYDTVERLRPWTDPLGPSSFRQSSVWLQY